MRTIALEEHFTVPSIVSKIDRAAIAARGFRPRPPPKHGPSPFELAPEIGPKRLALMDEAGISVQVLSNTGPGPDLVAGAAGVALAQEMNDHLAEAIAQNPERFVGFAVLPMASPEACAAEFERCIKQLGFVGALINGTTDGRFLDDPGYEPLLETATRLDAPIYIHPHLAPAPVRDAYYGNLLEGPARVLEAAGWGWHSETAIHILRLAVSGTLDRHPNLKLIIGHMGEMLPMMLARADDVFKNDVDHLSRPISKAIVDQIWVTTSGIFTEPPFLAALLTFGIDRLMFSVDFPYAANAQGRTFLDRLSLSPADMAKLTHGNADALLKLQTKPSR